MTQLFKHILQYLRTVKDGQDFALPERLDSTALAAIAAEAQFYGFTDLQAKVLQTHRRVGEQYEYKYIKIGNKSVQYYAPYALPRDGWYTWKHADSPNSAEIGAEGGLQYLHHEGWELYSHAAAAESQNSTISLVISLVFRRKPN